MRSNVRFFLASPTAHGFVSLGAQLRREARRDDTCLLLSGPGCQGETPLGLAAEAAAAQGISTELLLSPRAPFPPEALRLPERHRLAAIAAPFGGLVPPMPGPEEFYVNLSAAYDRSGLRAVASQGALCRQEARGHFARALRCFRAMGHLAADMQDALGIASLQGRLEKRAAGIARRELRRGNGAGGMRLRFLSAYTDQGRVACFDSVSALCARVYVLEDRYGLAHGLLRPIAAEAVRAGHTAIGCPSPLLPTRLEHLLIPSLSLALVSSTGTLPWPGEAYRRIHLDALPEQDTLRQQRGRLRLLRKMYLSFDGEATAALAEAGRLYQLLEEIYGTYVDQEALALLHREAVDGIMAVSE